MESPRRNNQICLKRKASLIGCVLSMLLIVLLQGPRTASAAVIVQFTTNLGSFNVELYDTEAPLTVANFLSYVESSLYDNSIIHRSTTYNPNGLQIIQGGGFVLTNNALYTISTGPPVTNEFGILNTRGTLAMAKVGGNPDSATSQWFFNIQDNPALDDTNNNGGYTVFGQVIDQGMNIVDQMAAVPVYNASTQLGSTFSELPLLNPVLSAGNLVLVNSIFVVPEPSTWSMLGVSLLLLMGAFHFSRRSGIP